MISFSSLTQNKTDLRDRKRILQMFFESLYATMPDTLGLLKASNAFLRCTKKESSFLCKCVVADRGGRVERHQSYLGTSVTTNNLTQSLLKMEVDLSVSKF